MLSDYVSGTESTHLVVVLASSAPVSVSGTRDDRIAQVAAMQRGRIAWRQLRAAGIAKATVYRLVANGRLYREGYGVYAVGHGAPAPWTRETSALLACRPGALLSRLTAAALWGLMPSADGPIEVTIAGHQTGHPNGVIVHRTKALHPSDSRIRERLPVTSPARTIFDIADRLPERTVERAIEEGLHRKRLRIDHLEAVLDRNPGRAAATILSKLLAQRTGSTISRSKTEEALLTNLRAAHLPPPEMNEPLLGFTADFMWREQRVIVEVDGFPYHSSRSAIERDRRKDATFRAAGWDVIRVSAHQVIHDPLLVIALIATALSR